MNINIHYEVKISLKKGFTLIELLVVVSIVAILAAILFPVFLQAKEAAKKANCISNVKQIVLAEVMYITDYDDVLSPFSNEDDDFTYLWSHSEKKFTLEYDVTGGLLYPYMKNVDIQDCPSANGIRSEFLSPFAYGYNFQLMTADTMDGDEIGTSLSAIERPAETIFIADSALFFNGSLYRTYYVNGCIAAAFASLNHGRHSGNTNSVGWIDGHAKAHRINVSDRGSAAADYAVHNLGCITKFPRVYGGPGSLFPDAAGFDNYYYSKNKPVGS